MQTEAHRHRPFVLLDRDGTIIEDRHYLSDPAEIQMRAGAVEGLRRLRAAGFGLVLITNQSGIARGFFDMRTLYAIHNRLQDLLRAQEAGLDAIYYCPHGPDDGCDCRKPKAGLIHRAARDFGFAAAQTFMIGDSDGDMKAARAFGATPVQAYADANRQSPAAAAQAADLSAAADWVIAAHRCRSAGRQPCM